MLLTAIAPITWGSTYFVTRHFLPADAPLWGAALRALPAGLVLLAVARRLPRGAWWWRSVLLGVLNFGGFFVLLYVTALWLPSSVAASIMALAPLVLAACGWALLRERPTAWMAAGSGVGIVGVLLIVGTGVGAINPWGVLTSLVALVVSSVGAVLNKKWSAGVDLVPVTAWQATAGGLMLVVAAAIAEGAPPQLSGPALAGFAYVSLIATALASLCWFGGLARLAAGTVGIIGLLNPVTGVLLGVLAGGEVFTALQVGGVGLVLAGILLGARGPQGRAPAPDAVLDHAALGVDD